MRYLYPTSVEENISSTPSKRSNMRCNVYVRLQISWHISHPHVRSKDEPAAAISLPEVLWVTGRRLGHFVCHRGDVEQDCQTLDLRFIFFAFKKNSSWVVVTVLICPLSFQKLFTKYLETDLCPRVHALFCPQSLLTPWSCPISGPCLSVRPISETR